MNNIFYMLYNNIMSVRENYEKIFSTLPDKNTVINRCKGIKEINHFLSILDDMKLLQKDKNENLKLIRTCRDLDIQKLAIEDTLDINRKFFMLARKLHIIFSNIEYSKEHERINSIILEIRAGAGGDEAGIFAYELLNMYIRYTEKKKWTYKIIHYSGLVKKSVKETIVNIKGRDIYNQLRQENGVHRVQRIPETESQGRIHTSTCSVLIMPEENIQKISINEKDIRVDVYRSSGPGGQSVNTTDSAVRILHLPTNIMAQCQNEKSQSRNKVTALNILKIKLEKYYRSKRQEKTLKEKRSIIGSADRSEKIRTYNFPHDRCTDHRTGISMQNIHKLFSGNLDNLISKSKSKNID